MKTMILALSVVLSAAAYAHARGHGFMGGRRSGVVRGASAARGSSRVFGGFSGGAFRPSIGRATAARGATPPSAPQARSGFVSSGVSRGSYAGGASRGRSAFGFSFSRPLTRPTFGRSTSSRVAARGTTRGLSGADSGGTSAPGWATPGSMIRTAGQPPVYSNPGNGGTHSIEGGGFIAMDQSRAGDVARSPGITRAAPDRTTPSASSSGGGGSGASSNGPAFNPAF